MAIAKAERLMNLALCLLGTRRPLSKRELRESVEAYLEAGSDDSFNRMFERDKDDLRELGLVIETVENLDGAVDCPRAEAKCFLRLEQVVSRAELELRVPRHGQQAQEEKCSEALQDLVSAATQSR